ncbi:MAG TPA: hypothetical protein VFZ24_15740 [Longimicrobiales bacterium]
MMTGRQGDLDRECRLFTGYLLGCVPTQYVLDRYADAHRVSDVYSTGTRFDAFLMRAARTGRITTKVVDAYAAILAPTSLIRRKLILLLAILETAAPTAGIIDSVDRGGRVLLFLRLCGRGIGSVLGFLIGALVFVPARLILTDAVETRA